MTDSDLPAGIDQGAVDAASDNVAVEDPEPAGTDVGTAPEQQPAEEEQRPAGTDETGHQTAPPPSDDTAPKGKRSSKATPAE